MGGMPARDLFHYAVRRALEKEGWTITHDPLELEVGGVHVAIDLGAEKLIGAEKDGDKIAVEIKSFVGPSNITEFHVALGQFLNYQQALELKDPNRTLFLAVPLEVYESFFMLAFVQNVTSRHHLKLIVYRAKKEVIVKWQT